MTNVLNKDQIISLKECGKILSATILKLSQNVVVGVSTRELDTIAENAIKSFGAIPAFKGYQVPGIGAYPSTICASLNDEVVHGLPGRDIILKDGDVISIDIGAKYNGICTDAARTYVVGDVSKEILNLIQTTDECLSRAVKVVKSGSNIGVIGREVQKLAESRGFGVVRDLVGHGIGPEVHLSPQIPNFGDGRLGPVIVEGMALAIEPMLTSGDYRIKTASDGWTIITKDGSLAAHFEDTVIVENGRATVVTR